MCSEKILSEEDSKPYNLGTQGAIINVFFILNTNILQST